MLSIAWHVLFILPYFGFEPIPTCVLLSHSTKLLSLQRDTYGLRLIKRYFPVPFYFHKFSDFLIDHFSFKFSVNLLAAMVPYPILFCFVFCKFSVPVTLSFCLLKILGTMSYVFLFYCDTFSSRSVILPLLLPYTSSF